MPTPALSIVWFPDCTLWEVAFLERLVSSLSATHPVRLVRVPSGGLPAASELGEKVWIVAHDWKSAWQRLRKVTRKKEVYVSILSLPVEKGSLFTLLWRRLMPSLPADTHLITHSPINYRFFREMEGWRKDRTTFLPFGSVLSAPPRPPSIAPEKNLVVGSLGRLVAENNFNYVFSIAHYVLQKRPDTIFRVLGTGPLYSHLVHSVRDLGLESRVEIVETEFQEFLSSVDILLYPPIRNDHFLPVLGAAELGCPVLSVDIPGIKELITDNKSGFIVPQFETKATAELLIRLLDHPELRSAMGGECQRTLAARFSPAQVAAQYGQLFWGEALSLEKAA